VVARRPLENQRSKRQKTERLDARALLDNLESYLRGNRDAMSIVAVPSPEQEQQRSVDMRVLLALTTDFELRADAAYKPPDVSPKRGIAATASPHEY